VVTPAGVRLGVQERFDLEDAIGTAVLIQPRLSVTEGAPQVVLVGDVERSVARGWHLDRDAVAGIVEHLLDAEHNAATVNALVLALNPAAHAEPPHDPCT